MATSSEGYSCLGIEDLSDVLMSCYSVRASWLILATYLRIDTPTVLAIQNTPGLNLAKCLHEALIAWLRRSSLTQPKPSWRSLCNALDGMGDVALSKKIQKEHPCRCGLCKDELQNTKLSLTQKEVEFLQSILRDMIQFGVGISQETLNSGANMASAKSWTDYKYYFAFGPNLKKERHLSKDFKFHCIGELKNYRLAFCALRFGSRWNGAVGTVLPTPGESVWGAIWEVTQEDIKALHIQEGVAIGLYKPIKVNIHTPRHGVVQCLTYVQLPINKPEYLPSLAYMNVTILGAKEVSLPSEYIRKLESTPHNGDRAYKEEFNRMAGLSLVPPSSQIWKGVGTRLNWTNRLMILFSVIIILAAYVYFFL